MTEKICLIKHRNVHPSMGGGGGGGINWVFSRDNHRVIINQKSEAAVFGLITKVLLTALCALLSVFSLNRLFWGGSGCSDNSG